ncbi:MAG: CBS domain-containing protein [Betaproteobacteria bacterium]|nr:CBS domain-containing protein [Betaproteobacteria bacterium]
MLFSKPQSKKELIELVNSEEIKDFIGQDSRIMLEGVLNIGDMRAGDIMVPSPRMDMLDIEMGMDELLDMVIDIGHSRYPVYEHDKENIIGVLMTKDLLKLQRAPNVNIKILLRTAVFVPESKKLIDLLRDFKRNRNHMAMVVDEFGRIAGLVTFEDVLEEIVGEIEDEFDTETDQGDIYSLVDSSFRVAGRTSIEAINQRFDTRLPTQVDDETFDTIGGLIAHEMGHVPHKGEHKDMHGLRFEVMHAKGGSVKWFRVKKIKA